MNIIQRKIKEIFGTKSNFLRSLNILPTGAQQYENSFSNKIEAVKKYIAPLNLQIVIIDTDLEFEILKVSYSGEKDLDIIVDDIRNIIEQIGIKRVELDYNGSKIIVE